LKVEGVENPKE